MSDPWIWILMVRYEGDAVLPSGITPFTVSFGLLWECEEKECFLYAAGYLLGLEVTLWFAGRLPAYGVLIGQAAWFGVNLMGNLVLQSDTVRKYRKQFPVIQGTMGAAFS